ncbi:substrate-binding periplasmic protein [Dongia sp.]|uniref:substrate-binding periplasmic protein n=1 Tax=Dongia sp. TaxID=1977262 RepID=UPI0035B45BB2
MMRAPLHGLRLLGLTTGLLVAAVSVCVSPSAADGRRVVLACNDFPPLKIEHPGPDGRQGTDVDAIQEIGRRTGIMFETRFTPWKRGYAEAADGTVDGLCSCSYREDRAPLFHFTDAIGETSVGIFHARHAEIHPIASLADLTHEAQGKVAVVKGYNLEAELEEAKIPHFAVSGDQQALEMLRNDRFDHLYSFRAPIEFIADHDGDHLPYTELRSSPYFICLSKNVPEMAPLVPAINKAIAAMKADGTFDAIQRRYGQTPIN